MVKTWEKPEIQRVTGLTDDQWADIERRFEHRWTETTYETRLKDNPEAYKIIRFEDVEGKTTEEALSDHVAWCLAVLARNPEEEADHG